MKIISENNKEIEILKEMCDRQRKSIKIYAFLLFINFLGLLILISILMTNNID